MAKYKCLLCGYIYDDEKEGIAFKDLAIDWKCPRCGAPKEMFEELIEANKKEEQVSSVTKEEKTLATYLSTYEQTENQEIVKDIHEMAKTKQMIISAMQPSNILSPWEEILILGAQLARRPLLEHEEVDSKIILGKNSKKPVELACPFYISHMSFGALSKEAKIALSKGASSVKTAMCSGEGGILPEEKAAAYRYIFEYVPNLYSVSDENLQASDAIEIKIGQGTKPGMGGHLPGEKVTAEIARIRGKKEGEDIISPSRFDFINNKEDLKNLVDDLRKRSLGRPIGVKIAAGHIEEDLDWVIASGADFVTIDGRGGATGASPKVIRDATSVPTLYALCRARRYLDQKHSKIELVMTGGFRTSSDIFKALALGADAIALATGPMIALGCDQYQICQTGNCPLGIATQNKALRSRLDIELSAQRVANYLSVLQEEIKTFCRLTGHLSIKEISRDDLVTFNEEISRYTTIKHGGK